MKPLHIGLTPIPRLKLGQAFQTVVDLEVLEGVVAEELRLEIYWKATNQQSGRERLEVVESHTLHKGPLVPPQAMTLPLDTRLPQTGPESWQGQLWHFQWGMRVVLEWAQGEQVLLDVPFELAGAIRQRALP